MSVQVERPSKEIIEKFRELSTCNVSDALDKLGLSSGISGIKPLFECDKIVGPVITMKLIPQGHKPSSGKHLGADAIEFAEPGDIIAIDNSGRIDQNCWGEILAFAAQQQGVAGVVIDGAARDVDIIKEIDFPMYARGVVPITARGRNVQDGFNCDIQLGGVHVQPIDILMADENGIVIIPLDKAEEVYKVSRELFEKEAEIVRLLKSGLSFAEVDSKSGYDKMLENK